MDPSGQLPLFGLDQDDPDVERFLWFLRHYGRLTRKQFMEVAGWDDRHVREAAEAAFDKVVKGQKGFCLTDLEDIETAQQAAEQSISQGKKMVRYGVALKRRLHVRIERGQSGK